MRFRFKLSPLTKRRLTVFKSNKRGFIAFWIFLVLFGISIFSDFIANSKPLMVSYDKKIYFPVFTKYSEKTFGGEFETEADYRDSYVQELINKKGYIVWPLIKYRFDTINYNLPVPAPAPPSGDNWLGTDDQGHDVLSIILYGIRLSVFFGLFLTILSSIIGIFAGAIQGYFGGLLDLLFQRFIEIWSSLPVLYILIIIASVINPTFTIMLFVMLLFSWMALVGYVRAEFLRSRNFEYVRAARALGVRNPVIIFKHILPNALVSAFTYMPFIISGSITGLTSLDFLGFGLSTDYPSLGRLLSQAKANLQAPWLAFTSFFVLSIMLTLLVFIGEAVRDAFDPRRIQK